MLEAAETEDEIVTTRCADAPAKETVRCEPARLKILVVEDDAATSAMIERCLMHIAAFEPQIAVAGTLKAAQFALGADDFDIVLIDEDMLPLAGPDWLQVLGNPSERCATVLLTGLLTGDGFAASAPSTGDSSASAYLAKDNLSPKRLQTTILTAVREHAHYCTHSAMSSECAPWDKA